MRSRSQLVLFVLVGDNLVDLLAHSTDVFIEGAQET